MSAPQQQPTPHYEGAPGLPATLQPVRSVTVAMATRFGMEPSAFEQTLRATVVPKECSREDFAAFLLVAKEYNLNPVTKEIYAFPKRGGGIQPIVSVDGWANLVNSHPQCDGFEFEDELNDNTELIAITCRMYRKDRKHAIAAKEYMVECYRDTDTWKKWPRRMLRHKALIQAARYAFGFAGIVDPDEAERFTETEQQPQRARAALGPPSPPPPPAQVAHHPQTDVREAIGEHLGHGRQAETVRPLTEDEERELDRDSMRQMRGETDDAPEDGNDTGEMPAFPRREPEKPVATTPPPAPTQPQQQAQPTPVDELSDWVSDCIKLADDPQKTKTMAHLDAIDDDVAKETEQREDLRTKWNQAYARNKDRVKKRK